MVARSYFFALAVLGLTSAEHVLHERRSNLPSGWTPSHRLDADMRIPMKIALKQSNMDSLEDYLMDISSPSSPNFGKHWDSKKIAESFAPSKETVDAVREWLTSAGITTDSHRIKLSESLGWVHLETTVEEAERLLKTEYHQYNHTSGARRVGCNEYHVHEAAAGHVDFITPTVHFDAKIGTKADDGLVKLGKRTTKSGLGYKSEGPIISSDKPHYSTFSEITTTLANCTEYITPDCLRELYSISYVTTDLQKDPFGIVEFSPNDYAASDLSQFFSEFSKLQVQRIPTLDSIDGGEITAVDYAGYLYEPDLDLEYGMSLINPIKVQLYQVGDDIESGSFDTFLDAIDASYCNTAAANEEYGGYDDYSDPIYPDPYTKYTGAYEGPLNCGGFAATKVISTSYGADEHDFGLSYATRQCNEYAKLGLAGSTILYSSGDYGVAGQEGACWDTTTESYTNGKYGQFVPTWPSTCPYVTSVGATQIGPLASDDWKTLAQPEVVANIDLGYEFNFSSAGGFSNLFAAPSYQKAALATYFKDHKPSYTSAEYNTSETSRGYPDVTANGAYFVVAADGEFILLFGTSCSAPTFASIITIINEYRAAVGKTSVGFINPTLYENPKVLDDIVSGNNPGCGTDGFEAVEGWDPLSGLGTPNFVKMLEVFLLL